MITTLRKEILETAKEDLGTPYKTLDCSKYVRKVFRKFDIELPRVSAEQGRFFYKKGLATEHKTTADKYDIIKNLQVGDLLFQRNKYYIHRWRRIHHVQIYIGDGYVIESTGSKGVHTSRVWESSKWEIILTADPTSLISGEEEDMIQKGDKGINVTMWQSDLIFEGHKLPKFGVDGKYGDETATATKAFQKSVGLPQSGIVDALTLLKMVDARATSATKVKALEAKISKAILALK